MNISSLSSPSQALASATLKYAEPAASRPASQKATTPADVKKAAEQFEAILLRQFISPALQSMMSQGLDGKGGGDTGGGGGMYGYLLTDTMANSLSQGGGLGLARILEKQFSQQAPQKL